MIYSQPNESAGIVGSPILRLDTCSESEVNFTCTVNQTELLWEVDFSRGPEIAPIRYYTILFG